MIGRLVVVGWPARDIPQASDWLARTLAALSAPVHFLVAPGGYLTKYTSLSHLRSGWQTPENTLEYFRADAAATVFEMWSLIHPSLRGKARYFTFGLDYRDEAPGEDRHAELVAVMDLETGALAHLTGKSFPTQDQEKTLLRIAEWETHFWGPVLLMGCHDLNVFSGRGASQRSAESARGGVSNDFFKALKRARPTPSIILHHPHSTEVVKTWAGGWSGAQAYLPNVAGASGISWEPLPSREPDALTVVLDRTRTVPTLDIGIRGNQEVDRKQDHSIPPRLLEPSSPEDFEHLQEVYRRGVLDADYYAKTGKLRRPGGRTTFPTKPPSGPRKGLKPMKGVTLQMGNPRRIVR